MVLLEAEKFLTEFEKCLTASKAKKKGSVFVTMKRYDGRTKPLPRSAESGPAPPETYRCLVRVTYGKRKLSCHVSQLDLNKFQIAFSALMRTGMSNIGKTTPGPAQPQTEPSAPTSKKASVVPTKAIKSLPVVSTPKKGKVL